MYTFASKRRNFYLAVILAFGMAGVACQPQPAANTNANAANANAGVAANVNASPTTSAGPVINTREPDKYSATLVLTAQTTGGERAVAIPQVSVDVARSGADRRLSFKLPSGEQIIYLDHADKHYIIAPDRKQYAELTPQDVGFQMGKLMTPGQIVAYLSQQRGYERVGDDQVNGRTADKYRYVGVAQTGTQAGDVKTETYVYVDKDTGLPLRSELNSEATGNVQGVKGLRVVEEMRDIKTDVDPSLFDVPQGYNKVSEEQVRQQVQAVTAAVTAVVGALLKNVNTQGGTTTTTTTTTTTSSSPAAASPSPTASAKP